MTANKTAAPERKKPLERSDFRSFLEIPTRWMDVDMYGHVNNVQYLSYFDTAVNSWYIENGLLDPVRGETVFLVAETGCNYFAELLFPSNVSAGLRIEQIGKSSVVFRVGLFSGEDLQTAAHGRFVHIHVDRQTRRPVPISHKTRKVLETLG
ncbi:acyl-CoA thioesterase [Roseibium alexandrii]|uniref:Acyl-CoA thioester hydrolase, YbgC/YbaW family n=1 Tax=Roseibium alexandrii TaxID=388408 RepID=A0A0M6ZWS7_9HYPH|nr:thioesterase family protein [Roseibium alexandrii]CTQ66727.1 acyl-CoA thioester hydrolase, YbgC/YbaW family [Roseibium alexandrii]